MIEKAAQVATAERQQVAATAADRAPEHAQQRSGSTPTFPGQEPVVRTQADLVKREADQKELAAQQEKLAYLKTLEQAALTNKVDTPERLSAIQADRAETQGKVTALIARERAQQLAGFTHGSEQEATSAAGRIFDKTTTTNPREALLLQIKQDKAGIGSSKAAGDPEGVSLANKTLLADQQKLAQYDQQRKDALQAQGDALKQQSSVTERLAGEMDKIARGSRTQPGDPYPALKTPADVATAKAGAYKRFAEGIVTESDKNTQGAPERQRIETAIAALLAQETAQVGARAALEEKIGQEKAKLGELDKADLERFTTETETIEASLAKADARLARLKAGAGGDIQGSIDDARKAAEEGVKLPTAKEMDTPLGASIFDARLQERQHAGDTAAENQTLTERLAALKETQTAREAYGQTVALADARLKAGIITEQQYMRSVTGTLGPLQAYGEEMDRIAAVEANVDLLTATGTMTLEERRRKLLQLDADKGRAAAGARSAQSRDLYDQGEAGSGVRLDKQVAGGALAGGLDIISQYGNAAKDAGELTKSFFEGTADSLTQFVMTGKSGLAQLGVSLEQMALKMAIQLALARALSAVFGLAGGGAAAGAANFQVTGSTGAAYGSARGNAFEGGELRPMATGGILSRETMIPMARGGWADAGEVPGDTEAVMPLKRNARGDLGVQTDAGGGGGSAPSIVINNHGEPVGQSDTKWDPDSRTLEVTIHKLVDNNIAAGKHNRAMKSAFGLTPNVRR